MSDDRRKFTDSFDEAKVQVAQGNDGDALSAAADVKPTARGLGVLAAVVETVPAAAVSRVRGRSVLA